MSFTACVTTATCEKTRLPSQLLFGVELQTLQTPWGDEVVTKEPVTIRAAGIQRKIHVIADPDYFIPFLGCDFLQGLSPEMRMRVFDAALKHTGSHFEVDEQYVVPSTHDDVVAELTTGPDEEPTWMVLPVNLPNQGKTVSATLSLQDHSRLPKNLIGELENKNVNGKWVCQAKNPIRVDIEGVTNVVRPRPCVGDEIPKLGRDFLAGVPHDRQRRIFEALVPCPRGDKLELRVWRSAIPHRKGNVRRYPDAVDRDPPPLVVSVEVFGKGKVEAKLDTGAFHLSLPAPYIGKDSTEQILSGATNVSVKTRRTR
eukprot:Polyplicarium_translucidae@DN3408_c1_g1_i6.p1